MHLKGANKFKEGHRDDQLQRDSYCDCATWSDAPIVPDIGFLASTDPVALDQASYDLVNKQHGFSDSHFSCNHESGANKFQGLRPYIDGTIQMRHGEEIGMGSRDYELIVL